MIKKKSISSKLIDFFVEKHRHFQENIKREKLIFYTDRSLIKAEKEDQSLNCMGASWVQVDTKEEYVINKSAIRARGWPSSTKAELLAIWCVILIVPSKSKIKIHTDSAAAIANISNNS